jgi:hypothetical protein
MNRTAKIITGLLFLIIACVFITACTGSSGTANTTPQTTLVTTAPSTAAQYTSGDIVRSPKGSPDTAWLVTGYDPATDFYERAFVYRNADGTWGYRLDTRTERATRAVMEKVYTEKITNKLPASIPIRQPTVAATASAMSTTPTVTATTSATTALKPQIKSIEPDFGMAGSQVAITDLTGNYFQTGATVMLAKTGSPNITATSATVQSPLHMSCSFSIPSNTTTGPWEVVVTNPDGQSIRYANGFTVRVSTNPVTTTVTTGGGVDITGLVPTFGSSGDTKSITITGSNFLDRISVKLKKSGSTDIAAFTTVRISTTQMSCVFTIPVSSIGFWDLVVTNTDGTTGTLQNAFQVQS